MREIKFRLWNGKALVYGGFCIHSTGQLLRDGPLGDFLSDAPVMQFTGLKDSSGNDIYEGDILKTTNGIGNVGAVEWHDSGVYRTHTDSGLTCWLISGASDFLVIGDKFNNPELLT